MQDLVSVEIRSHLIPFFFHEMEGTPASYQGQKVNMIKLKCSSSLANYLYTQINYNRAEKRPPHDSFLLYLSVQTNQFLMMTGTIYIDKKGVKNELLLPKDKAREFNNLLEDIYRTSLVFFIDGYRAARNRQRGPVREGVILFMEKYNMQEYGFEPELVRKMYYEQKSRKLLNRFQTRSTNNATGYI